MKKNNNKGFTLAEMLIVVAIIGVLIAILVPTFSAQLEKANKATDQANIRSYIAEVTANGLAGSGDTKKIYNGKTSLGEVEIAGITLSGSGTVYTIDYNGGSVTVSAS